MGVAWGKGEQGCGRRPCVQGSWAADKQTLDPDMIIALMEGVAAEYKAGTAPGLMGTCSPPLRCECPYLSSARVPICERPRGRELGPLSSESDKS